MDKNDKRIYLASAIACAVILLGRYGYGYCQDRKNTQKQQQEQKQTVEPQQKKPIVPKPSIGNPAPYGIEIENTTEEEIRDRFEVVEEGNGIFNEKYKVLCLNTEDFSSKNLPIQGIELSINQKGLVIRFLISYKGKKFSELHSHLSKKYTITFSGIPFVGNKYAEYTSKNIKIVLTEAHLGFVTNLVYVTKQFYDEIDSYYEKQRQEEQQKIAKQL
jgi:hypothetical protein